MSEVDVSDMEGKLRKGIEVTKEAIAAGDAGNLKRCIDHFLSLNAPADKIAEAIMDCPISLFSKLGYAVKVRSAKLGRDITLGKDISWSEIPILITSNNGGSGDALPLVFEAKDLFGGTVVADDAARR